MYKRVAGVEREAQLHDVRRIHRPLRRATAAVHLERGIEAVAVRVTMEQVSITGRRPPSILAPARFVASQRGAQFTPDGTLKFLQQATAPEEVLATSKRYWKNSQALRAAAQRRPRCRYQKTHHRISWRHL
jgi:hypothetical protein